MMVVLESGSCVRVERHVYPLYMHPNLVFFELG